MSVEDLPFDSALISDALRPVFALPLDVAQLCVQAFAAKAGVESLASQVRVSYTASRHFDAYAYSEAGQHHVVLSATVPAVLLASFFEIMRSTNPFSDDPSQADDAYQPGDVHIPLTLPTAGDSPVELAEAIEWLLKQSMPEHRWQRILAVTLAELAVVFVFAHEIGHVVQGHTQALHATRGRRLHEMGMAERADLGRVAQSWELQADRTAFGFLWSYAINTKRQRDRFVRQLLCKSEEPDLDLLGRLCYAMSLVFFLLSQGDGRVRTRGTHPSPLVRITFLLAMAETVMEARRPALAPKVHDCVMRAHDDAEAAWNRLGLEFGQQGYAANIEDLPAVVQTLERHLGRVERLLGHHAWVRLAKRVEAG